jgi:hypothetical protein
MPFLTKDTIPQSNCQTTQQTRVTTHVCIPNSASNAPDLAYNVSEFTYHKELDQYTCPAGQALTSNGNWYHKRVYRVKQHKTKNCKNCPVKDLCTKAKYQRIIERHEFAEALEKNEENNTKILKYMLSDSPS